jgi:hypothetical protein
MATGTMHFESQPQEMIVSGILGDLGYLSDNTNSKNLTDPPISNEERAAQE